MASGRKERIISRRKLALELREAGMCYRDIATTLTAKGYECKLGTAYKDVKAALQEIIHKTSESADRLRTLEVNRLDVMLKSIWTKVLKGDVASIDRALKIQERRAKLLGLDAPTKTESLINNNVDEPLKIVFIKSDNREPEDGDVS